MTALLACAFARAISVCVSDGPLRAQGIRRYFTGRATRGGTRSLHTFFIDWSASVAIPLDRRRLPSDYRHLFPPQDLHTTTVRQSDRARSRRSCGFARAES